MGIFDKIKGIGLTAMVPSMPGSKREIVTVRDMLVETVRSFMPPAIAGMADTLNNEQVDLFIERMGGHGYYLIHESDWQGWLIDGNSDITKFAVSAATLVPMVASDAGNAATG